MEINNKYNYGDLVKLIVDPNEVKYMVTGFLIKENSILYEITNTIDVMFKQEIEIELHEQKRKRTGFFNHKD